MRTVKVLCPFILCFWVISCGGRQAAAPPDFEIPSAQVTPRFAQADQALGFLADAFDKKLLGPSQSRQPESNTVGLPEKGPSTHLSSEQKSRLHAQDAMDELDAEVAGLEKHSGQSVRVTSQEAYASRQSRNSASSADDAGKTMIIAIVDFVTESGKVTKLGRYISDKLSPYFARTGRFMVLERTLMDRVLQEQQFQVSAFVDENSTVEFGKLIGAETILSGTVSDLGDVYYINAKAIDVTKGHLLAAVDVELSRNRRLMALYQTELPHLNKPRIKTRVFRAQGLGIPSAKHQNPALARAMALRAAKGDAMRNLARQIHGVQLDSDTTIQDMITQDDTIRIQLNASLQGARVVQQRQNPDGSVEVEMEVELTEDLVDQLYTD